MNEANDIINLEDIKKLVDGFYGKVRNDALLSPVFNERIGDKWPQHLEKMYAFWQTILLGEHTYFGSPFPPHAKLPVTDAHFERWMELFIQTADELFAGEKATEAKVRAGKMTEMFKYKIAHYRSQGFQNLI
jgi:hemoglobin